MPIAICMGFSERINEIQARMIDIKGFWMKPVIRHKLAQMVRKVLDGVKKRAGPVLPNPALGILHYDSDKTVF